jgi:hypothetical protein
VDAVPCIASLDRRGGQVHARAVATETKGREPALDQETEERFFMGAAEATRFFMGESDVQHALEKLARLLDEDGIPYAILGGMALNAYGYRRVTIDVDVLLTREGLEAFRAKHLGLGYVQRFPGSKRLRDTENGVPIDVVLAGEYPGDGRPKPVAFPDPAVAAVRGDRIALLPLPQLVELKLASGMTAPHRLRDLADVLELVRILGLPADLADRLAPFVRDKYLEIWQAAQAADPG